MKARVGGIVDLSTVDWQGNTCSMIFFAGCNLRCPFCCNASLIPLKSGAEVDLEMLQERIAANHDFIEGLGATGGEPSLQPDAIHALFAWAKETGFKTFLNTNGTNPNLLTRLAEAGTLSYVALDIKAPLEVEAYNRAAGLSDSSDTIAKIRETLKICIDQKIPFEARTTIVPTLIDDENSIRKIAKLLEGHATYYLQEFFPFEEIPDLELRRQKPPTKAHLIQLAKTALHEGVAQAYIRTREYGAERITL